MPLKMRAAVVEDFGKPLVIQEWDIPKVGPGQIAGDVAARVVSDYSLM
jgi:D-arabinose 1-dehydrogenase-like Zn-dependent alcohol dehydrogenase